MAAALAAALAAAATAKTAERADPVITMPRVEVKGQALRGANRPYSAAALDTEMIRDQGVSQTQDLFALVPGMTVRNFGLSGVADVFVMRGFSGGGHGGDVGIVIDGIPLNEAMSHADGYADLNVVIPLEVADVTLFKGPVSPLYGNFNRGGLIVIDTRKTGAYRQADFSLGSFSTGDAQVALGTRLGTASQLNLAAQVFRTEGFRPRSDFTRATLAGRWSMALSPSLELAVSGRLHHGDGNSAGYVTQAQFFGADPRGIDPRTQNDGARKTFQTARIDLNALLAPDLKLLTFAYGTRQDFSRFFSRPVTADPAAAWRQREETYDRSVFGAGASLNGRHPVAGTPLTWVVGLETFRESTDFQFYDGLANRQRIGPALNDRRSTLNSVSVFGEGEWPLHRLFKPTLGVRFDRFTGACRPNGAETATDPCGPLAAVSHASPKFGVRSDVAPGVQLRASVAEGFALPSNFIKYAAGAADLEPNIFRQTELGVAWRLGSVLRTDLAVYRTTSTQEFRTIAPGVFENSGATLRRGLELSATLTPVADLEATLAYGRAESEVTQNANAAILGKRITGVPNETTTLSLAWAPSEGFGAKAAIRQVGSYALNATNTLNHGGYRSLDLGLTYTAPAGWLGLSRLRLSAEIDNALDRNFATSAFVIGGQTLYAPAAPRTLKLSASLDF